MVVILILAGSVLAQAQERAHRTPSVKPDAAPVFQEIERGMAAGNPESFAGLFGSTVALRLRTQEQGIVSGNQARTILSTFFVARRPVSFFFSRMATRTAFPFATGALVFVEKGSRRTSQVYVSLQLSGGRWRISQFNIYESSARISD